MMKRTRIAVVLIMVFVTLIAAHFAWANDTEVRVGVLAKRGIVRCLEKWSPTAKYLTTRIPGKTFRIVPLDFGGWRMAWRELKDKGINPYRDFKRLQFGGTHDTVVYAVRDGKVDVGTVRTDTLESMEIEDKITLQDFRILHEHGGKEVSVPFVHSTRSYPE